MVTYLVREGPVETSLGTCPLGTCPLGTCPLGKLSAGNLSAGELVRWELVHLQSRSSNRVDYMGSKPNGSFFVCILSDIMFSQHTLFDNIHYICRYPIIRYYRYTCRMDRRNELLARLQALESEVDSMTSNRSITTLCVDGD